MKIYTEGARFWGGQVDRIDQGFVSLGYELTKDIEEAHLVYSNNGSYDNIVQARKDKIINGKVILNVLDLAPHLGDQFDMAKTREQLGYADVVTCISETVQKDLKVRGGFDSTVIYNPMKPITRDWATRQITALFVGRVNDPEKRAGLGITALRQLKIPSTHIVTTGGEKPYYGGAYVGVSDDNRLNRLYNASEFLICPTRNAFLGLPILEACAAGTIPIFCRDLDIRKEFFPTDLFPEYSTVEPTVDSIAGFMWGLISDADKMAAFQERIYQHYLVNLAEKLSPMGVAQRIINVYNKINV